jgi:hypothetical protein
MQLKHLFILSIMLAVAACNGTTAHPTAPPALTTLTVGNPAISKSILMFDVIPTTAEQVDRRRKRAGSEINKDRPPVLIAIKLDVIRNIAREGGTLRVAVPGIDKDVFFTFLKETSRVDLFAGGETLGNLADDKTNFMSLSVGVAHEFVLVSFTIDGREFYIDQEANSEVWLYERPSYSERTPNHPKDFIQPIGSQLRS